jgi:radical SAM superfamily enzyme YgiQ (UPF0313 family)
MNEKECDILLINAFSWTTERRACYLPYGVLYLAAYLRQNKIKVDIYDRNADYSLDIDKSIAYFEEKKPPIVGISVLTGPVISDALQISRRIKSIAPQTIIIWGGLHPTIFPGYVLGEESVDFIIQGEGEEPLLELVRALLDKKPYSSIMNLGFKNGGKIALNPMRKELLSLDSVEMPAWDLLEMKHYIANRFFASRVLTMNTSRGCTFKCTFCFNQGLPHQRWRGLSASSIKEQIDYLRKKYSINGIQFYEDSFDTDKRRVRDFCELMRSSGLSKRIKWSHFSNIPFFDSEVVACEKDAGLRYIEYGVESGSQRILDWVQKRQTVQQIKRVFDECKRIGIKTAALFMIGFPDETYEELMMTVDLVERLPAHILICTIYRPYPATPLFDYCVKNKKFAPPDRLQEQAEFYRFSHLKDDELNMSKVETNLLLDLQKRFYAKFVIKEALLCLREFNFGLLFYYTKQQVRPSAFSYTFKALLTRLNSLKKRKT